MGASSQSYIPPARTTSIRWDYSPESRPQSDPLMGESSSNPYASQYFSFSQLCLQVDNNSSNQHPYAATGSTQTSQASSHRSVVRAVGSQLVTIVRDESRPVIRRSTLSTIARKYAERKSEWLEDDHQRDVDEDELAKQREHRAKAARVLALLEIEQEQLEREERTEQALHQENEEREKAKEKVRLELDTLDAKGSERGSQVESEGLDWKAEQESIDRSSSQWAWDYIKDMERKSSCREEMTELVRNFEEENSKVWKEVIRRYKSCSDLSGREPLAPLVNVQLRGQPSEILRLQEKRQHQLKCWWAVSPYSADTT